MIAADTSSLIAFLDGEETADAIAVKRALQDLTLHLPPVVVMEALSDPKAVSSIRAFLEDMPMLEITGNYWIRAAATRQLLLGHGLKAKLGDALVAQSCIDHDAVLITRDRDFRHFTKYCGLKLYDA